MLASVYILLSVEKHCFRELPQFKKSSAVFETPLNYRGKGSPFHMISNVNGGKDRRKASEITGGKKKKSRFTNELEMGVRTLTH